MSHPTWVRGLKLATENIERCYVVAPYVGAWIETDDWRYVGKYPWSHPTWVRGLKRQGSIVLALDDVSHPTWVRGLKRKTSDGHINRGLSHPTWVRGLKLLCRL